MKEESLSEHLSWCSQTQSWIAERQNALLDFYNKQPEKKEVAVDILKQLTILQSKIEEFEKEVVQAL